MITVKITGLDKVERMYSGAERQVRYAAAVALTKTAKAAESALRTEMQSAFQSASPYTLRSQYVRPANKVNLTAIVGIKDAAPARGTAPAMLLKEHFTGGRRGNKPMEVALGARHALPPGYMAIPGAGMAKDAYGNPKKAAVSEVLGALKAGVAVYSGRGKRAATVGYFVVPIQRTPGTRHLVPGVYRRIGRSGDSAIQPVFLFVKRASYRKLFDLVRTAKDVVASDFDRHFAEAFENALRTAR